MDPARPPRSIELSAGPLLVHDSGAGIPVVLLHGLLVNGALWRAVAPAIAERARVLIPDLPLGGHGAPMHAEALLDPPAVADLVVELMDRLGVDRAVIVGNDTGGAIAQLLTARHPDRVEALLLTPCDAFGNFLPVMLRYAQLAARVPGGVRLAVRALAVPAIRRLPIALGWLAKHEIPRHIEDHYLTPARRDPGVRRDLGKVLRGISRRQTIEAAEALRNFPRPQVIVWADTRRIFPLRHGRRLAEQAPDGRLVVVPDSFAFVPEDQPQAVIHALADLIEEIELGARATPAEQ